MNKFIPLFLGLMFPLSGAFADAFTDRAVEFCKNNGGSYVMDSKFTEQGDQYCKQVTCKKTNTDKYTVDEATEKNAANVEATKQVCVAKSIIDGSFQTNGAQNGSQSGATSGSTSGATSGQASGATSGAASGSASGAASGAASGSASGAASGSSSGSTSGATSGSGAGDAISCEELEGEGRIEPGGLCYNECKPKRDWKTLWTQKKSGFERKTCVECLLRYPGVYRVKKEYLPKDKDGKVIGDRGVDLGKGVTVKTGVIVCKDSKGNIVSVTAPSCPAGTVLHTGNGNTVIVAGTSTVGSGGGSGNGTIIVGGGVAGGGAAGGNGGLTMPNYCHSTKQKDIDLCNDWFRVNGRFFCSSGSNISRCTGGYSDELASRYDLNNCVNCQAGGRARKSGWEIAGDVASAFAMPLAHLGSAYLGYKGVKAGAEASVKIAEQCRLDHQDYRTYLSANEGALLTPYQNGQLGCNGYGLNQFAGLQNGGLGAWLGAGYSPGFIGGMMGPYGGYNPYGQGGYVGGVIGGLVGGVPQGGYVGGGYVGGGYVGGGYPGAAGGFINGVSIAGGAIGGGYPGYASGGYVGGGYVGGGYIAGGGIAQGGYVAGMPQGGYVGGGYPGYVAGGGLAQGGGFVNGISIAGGAVGGGGYPGYVSGGYVAGGGGYIAAGQVGGYVNGGYLAGGYAQGGYAAGGYAAGGYAQGGYLAGGYAQGGYQGGYAAGGYAQGGYMAGGYAAGGYAQGGYQAGGYMAGGYNMQAEVQGANYDRMMQQQGTSFQMGSPMGYGASGYPLNAGYQMGMGY